MNILLEKVHVQVSEDTISLTDQSNQQIHILAVAWPDVVKAVEQCQRDLREESKQK